MLNTGNQEVGLRKRDLGRIRTFRAMIESILLSIIIFLTANQYLYEHIYRGIISKVIFAVISLVFLLFVITPTLFCSKKQNTKIQACYNACIQLVAFLISSVFSFIYIIVLITKGVPFHEELSMAPLFFGVHCIFVVIIEAIVFWSGIIRLYLSSTQIRIKWRIIGAICGMIPIVNLFILFHMLKLAFNEVAVENEKVILNRARAKDKICETKYPLLMVHGVFFRDYKLLNYWGRIPEELERNGATIFYGKQESALSVEESAEQLVDRIRQVLKKTGAEKVNIIAHSKGGLDSRYAISKLGMDDYVASLTTINTPHRGCEFADYLLNVIPKAQQNTIAAAYNSAAKKIGDDDPDFMAAVNDLTASACKKRNEEVLDSDKVLYFSYGSCLEKPEGGRFPLNMTNGFVKHFDGRNDGLVGEKSFEWGESFTLLENKNNRGISHGDMIDLNRENIKGFDVREFYVQLVAGLKDRGL